MIVLAVSSTPMVSTWIAVPVAAFAVVVIAAHMALMARSEMPASRRRIRTATGWLMLMTCPLAAFAFGIATPGRPTEFLLAFMGLAGLLCIIILLAAIDLANTRRLVRQNRDELMQQWSRYQREARSASSGSDGPRER